MDRTDRSASLVTILLGKRVKFTTNRDAYSEGIVVGTEMLYERQQQQPSSGYAILLDTGEIKHIASWRLVGLVSAATVNVLPILSKRQAQTQAEFDKGTLFNKEGQKEEQQLPTPSTKYPGVPDVVSQPHLYGSNNVDDDLPF